jgi:hypothetical protein
MERLKYDNFEKTVDPSVIVKTGILKTSWKKFEQLNIKAINTATSPIVNYSAKFQIAEWHNLAEAFIEIEAVEQLSDPLFMDYLQFPFLIFLFNDISISFNSVQIETASTHNNLYPQLRNYLEDTVNFEEIETLCPTGFTCFPGNVDVNIRYSNKRKTIKYNGMRTNNGSTRFKFMLSEFSQFFKNPNFLPNSTIEISFNFNLSFISSFPGVSSYTSNPINTSYVSNVSETFNIRTFFKMYDLEQNYHHILNSYIANNPLKFNVSDVRLANVLEMVPKNTLMRGNICVNTNEFDSLCLLTTESTRYKPPQNAVSETAVPYSFGLPNFADATFRKLEALTTHFFLYNVPVYFSKFILSIDDHVVINYEKDNCNLNFFDYLVSYHKSILRIPEITGALGYYNIPLIFEFSRYFQQTGFRNQISMDRNIKFEFNYYAAASFDNISFLFITILNRQFTYLNNRFFLNKEF